MEVINKQISRNYEIIKKFEAGIILTGPEVKSAKLSNLNFKAAYCAIGGTQQEGLRLKNFYIAPYLPAKREQVSFDPYRPRQLLLHQKELDFLFGKLKEAGMTVIPLRIYTKHHLVKLEIGLARGLKKYDKREKIKEEEFKRRKQRLVLAT
jgi:SsrA-binding protein